jgi:hypothetical protein
MWPPQLPSQQQQQVITSTSRQFDSRLPPYRPAPDYETAVRNKYGSGVLARINQTPQPSRFQQQQQQHQHQYSNGGLHTSQPTLITDGLTNVYNNNNNTSNLEQRFQGGQDSSYHLYHTNLISATPSNAYSTSTPELNNINQTYHQAQQQHQHQQHYQPLNTSSQMIHQYSSSNRIDHIQPTQDQIVAELQRLNIYKPPPPYPGRNNNNNNSDDRQNNNPMHYQQQQQRMMSSTSTPDLAGQFVGGGRHQVVFSIHRYLH